MPHIVIEYTHIPSVQDAIEGLLDAVIARVKESPIIDIASLKLRATPIHHYRVAGGHDPFIHTTVALMRGKDERSINDLSTDLFRTIASHFPDIHQITVDVREMDPAPYRKRGKEHG
jgi:5-carboxymethyl-2-hydroxymuconate isomerase